MDEIYRAQFDQIERERIPILSTLKQRFRDAPSEERRTAIRGVVARMRENRGKFSALRLAVIRGLAPELIN